MPDYAPVETTAELGAGLAAGTHGVLVAPGLVYIAGAGEFATEAYRVLAAWEIEQLTYVFPHLFTDMAEEHRRRA